MHAFRRPNPVFSDDYRALREALIAARRRARITQRELAARIGKCGSHVCMIERGQRRIDVVEFYLMTRVLGVDAGEILSSALEQA